MYVTIIWSDNISVDACHRSGCTSHRPLSWNFVQRQTSTVGVLGHIYHLHFSHIAYASQRNRTCKRSLYIRFVSTEDSQQIPAIFPWTEPTLKVVQQSSARVVAANERISLHISENLEEILHQWLHTESCFPEETLFLNFCWNLVITWGLNARFNVTVNTLWFLDVIGTVSE